MVGNAVQPRSGSQMCNAVIASHRCKALFWVNTTGQPSPSPTQHIWKHRYSSSRDIEQTDKSPAHWNSEGDSADVFDLTHLQPRLYQHQPHTHTRALGLCRRGAWLSPKTKTTKTVSLLFDSAIAAQQSFASTSSSSTSFDKADQPLRSRAAARSLHTVGSAHRQTPTTTLIDT